MKIVKLLCNTYLSFKVVRLCAKSREAVSSPVEHLTLHYQVSVAFTLTYILFISWPNAVYFDYFPSLVMHLKL